jgi:P27 family predicted phage terminase small subunit
MSRRVPTAVKRMRGTLRRGRMKAREPRPLVGAPPCRRQLPPAIKAMHRRLVRILAPLQVVTVADGLALELAASALVEYEANAKVVLEHGTTYEARTEAGAMMHRARPEQAIAADAWRRAATMLQQFGLTPASRNKVEAIPPGADDDLNPLTRLRQGKWARFVP